MPKELLILPIKEAAVTHSHMVIYQTSDGEPGSRQFDEIGAAIAFVEEMRNRSGVDVARIFKLEEVKFEFRPYYQVLVVEGAENAEGAAAAAAAGAPAAEAEVENTAPAAASTPAAESAPAAAAAEEAPAVDESAPLAATAVNEVATPAEGSTQEPTSGGSAHAMPPASDGAGVAGNSSEDMASAGSDPSGATRRGLFGR